MKFKRKALALCSSALLALSLFTGCSSKPQEAAGEETKTLRFGVQMFADGSVNTVAAVDPSWNAMRFGITEALFRFNDSMEAEPWLAEGYTVNDAHTEWTITLKEGVLFSNGEALTASKVKRMFDYIKEVGPSGSAKPEKFLEYEAVITADDAANTVTITTSKPYANLIGQLAYPVMAILDVDNMTDFDTGAIGTGPYMIEQFNGVGVGYSLVANPHYREAVPYDKVEILFMGDASAKTMALRSGQVDLVENITNVADIAAFQEDADFTVDIAPGVRTGFSWMNFDGILGNKALRQAIIMGVDQKTICESKTIGSLYTPGYSILPSSLSYGYESLNNPYPYDPEAAKALLDEAGIIDTDGDGFRELDGKNIDLRYVSYESRLLNDFSNAHIQYLAEIGIKTTADFGSSDDQWSKLSAGEYDLNNNNWSTVGTGDPYDFMANWSSAATYCGYSNPEYDALYEQLKSEHDKDARAAIYQQLQQILLDDAVILIDGYYNSSMVYSKNVANAHIHTADYYWLTTEVVPAA